jgi:hypothetical protein
MIWNDVTNIKLSDVAAHELAKLIVDLRTMAQSNRTMKEAKWIKSLCQLQHKRVLQLIESGAVSLNLSFDQIKSNQIDRLID